MIIVKPKLKRTAYLQLMSRKIGFSFVFVAIAACLGIYLSRGPWAAYGQQKQKADVATKEMNKAEQDTTELLRQKAALESPLGREAQARKQMWLKPDEQPLNQDH